MPKTQTLQLSGTEVINPKLVNFSRGNSRCYHNGCFQPKKREGSFVMFSYLRFPTTQQSLIWLERRQHILPSVTAKELGVSRPFVAKAQRIAESRIDKLISHAAAINRIRVQKSSPRFGFALGYCPGTESTAYIVYSPSLGVQTWFAHRGDCAICESQASCYQTVQQLSRDWRIPFGRGLSPTDAARVLFSRVQEELGWTSTD